MTEYNTYTDEDRQRYFTRINKTLTFISRFCKHKQLSFGGKCEGFANVQVGTVRCLTLQTIAHTSGVKDEGLSTMFALSCVSLLRAVDWFEALRLNL
ncbi:hypothetical protein RO3G_13392 [Rhizopus delemar RA 99-880]|uniref:Uncharacterized protein n=1 Tax=Rhizopus delemar (strain RA 99-880 / ATCC MYA-4621 / FGSC 9543 / NRRL 43880) TaxID=246409 RepID=I1CJQ1_RHIO9|nr:hypothetical protein RO3G_13392 [Rhizopus delemar RA 99-880]|eukprot:EIE88681.1 hypothetical protein RO3G_13392 [Rhizopus delemar RA 99-880]